MLKDVSKTLNAKRFNYKKSLAAYYANNKGKVVVFPKKPNESDTARLKLKMQDIINDFKNPADSMAYNVMLEKVEELKLKVKSNKKADLHSALKKYYFDRA